MVEDQEADFIYGGLIPAASHKAQNREEEVITSARIATYSRELQPHVRS